MQEFQRKKDKNLLFFNNFTDRDNSNISTDQTKNLYDYTLKHEGQIKRMETEISNLKSQIIDLTNQASESANQLTKLTTQPSELIDRPLGTAKSLESTLIKDSESETYQYQTEEIKGKNITTDIIYSNKSNYSNFTWDV